MNGNEQQSAAPQPSQTRPSSGESRPPMATPPPQMRFGDQKMGGLLPEPKKRTWLWWVFGAVVLLLILFLAAAYFSVPPVEEGTVGVSEEPATVPGTAEDVAAVEKALEGLDTEGLDAELESIEQELQGL